MPNVVFEVSWEICHEIGGIHTVVAGKVPTMVARHGDDYVAVGPYLGTDSLPHAPFEEEEGFEDFREACAEHGVDVRVGRWTIPGRPRTLLVGFAGLFEQKDGILAGLWERHGVDSLTGGWEYIEPVLFATGAGIAIDKWWHEYVAPRRERAVAQLHDWTSGAALLHLSDHLPAVGTVFVTHGTSLGRALAGRGDAPLDALGSRDPAAVADDLGIRSRHSLEGAAIRAADVFGTVSRLAADEAERFHGRPARPLVPNGLDAALVTKQSQAATPEETRARLLEVGEAFLGEAPDDPLLVAMAGRYEMHNKGIDVFLQALAALESSTERCVLAFLFVPAGASGVKRDLKQRLESGADPCGPPLGISTHDLFDPDRDPIRRLALALGLDNAHGRPVKVLHVPVHLDGKDGLLNLPAETVLRGMDITCHPSFYEPWGHMPALSLACGTPSLTTDCAGFGLWAREQGLGPADGIEVLARAGREDREVVGDLVEILGRRIPGGGERGREAEAARRAAARLDWKDLVQNYVRASDEAAEAARARVGREPLAPQRRKVPITVQPPQAALRPRLVPFDVAPVVPTPLEGLKRLARNLWWSWDPEAPGLFEAIDPATWREVGHNPLSFLRRVTPEALEARAADAPYCAGLARALRRFDAYLDARRADAGDGIGPLHPVAYFCLEFAVHESLRIYAGGLGVLAGDHLKAASDRGLPLVGVGLFYRQGYAEQQLSPHGDQVSRPASNDPADLPMTLVQQGDGQPLIVEVGLPSSTVKLQVWRVDVGRVPLYLLDADLPANRPADRAITRRLYAGDRETRLLQEMILGKGGVRLLAALELEPAVFHLNEGHAAFAGVERAAQWVHKEGLTYDEADEIVRSSTAFTTHTPVPAGHDRFPEDLMRRYFAGSATWAGLPWERFYGLGSAPDEGGSFNMTYLALSLAAFVNGVSLKHAEVSRALLSPYFPGLMQDEIPVDHVTNGVHLATWTHPDIARLLGVEHRAVSAEDFRRAGNDVDAAELWAVRRRLRQALLDEVGARLEHSMHARGESPRLLERMRAGLDPDALVVVFARRFSPYKRATLLLRERERLRRLLSDPERPVRLLFAGKAHPEDGQGQALIREIANLSRHPDFVGRLFFVENYDVALARRLVQGADVWLNNPRPPQEASGTSGMKAVANGGLNLSVLDGWWIEGYDGDNGWAIPAAVGAVDEDLQDEQDAGAILTHLEEDVVPAFFGSGAGEGPPREWIRRVRHAFRTLAPRFSAARMLDEYVVRAYRPLARAFHELRGEHLAPARQLAERHHRVQRGMETVRIEATRVGDLSNLRTGEEIEVEVDVALGDLATDDVEVELVLSTLGGAAGPRGHAVVALQPTGATDDGVQRYEGRWSLQRAGSYGWGVRVRPRGRPGRLHRFVRWA